MVFEEAANQDVEKPMSPAFMNGKTGTVLNVYTKPQCRHHGYSLYKSIGVADSVSRYHQMEWRNEGAEKNTL